MFKIEDYKQVIEKICRDLRVKRLDLVGLHQETISNLKEAIFMFL